MNARVRQLFVCLLGITGIAFTTMAQAVNETPASLPGATLVTAEKAKALMDSGVLMVDARVANEYVEEHVKGAKNIPYKEKSARSVNFDANADSFDVKALPSDKATPVIFYCNGGECWKSYKACRAAIKAGYNHVYWMRGGMPEWKAKGLPTE